VLRYLVETVWEGKTEAELEFRALALGVFEEGGYRMMWPRTLAAIMELDWGTLRDYLYNIPQWPVATTLDNRLGWGGCPIIVRLFSGLKRSDAVHMSQFDPYYMVNPFGSARDPPKPGPQNENNLTNLRMQIARDEKENKKLRGEIDRLKRESAKRLEEIEMLHLTLAMVLKDKDKAPMEGGEMIPKGNDGYPMPMVDLPVVQRPTIDQDERRVRWLEHLLETARQEQLGADHGQRRFRDEDLVALGFVLMSLNRHSYGMVQAMFGMPSEVTVWDWSLPRRQFLKEVLIDGNPSSLVKYLTSWRLSHGIPDGQKIRVNLGVDATSATASGIRDRNTKTGYCFVFVMFPHSAEYPDVVLRSVYADDGNFGPKMKDVRDELMKVLTFCDFIVRWKCTDGDTGMNTEHNDFRRECNDCGETLSTLVPVLYERKLVEMESIEQHELDRGQKGTLDDPITIPKADPASDDWHIEKNVRSRGADAIDGIILTVAFGVRGTCAKKLESHTGGPKGPFGNRRRLDRLSDALAAEAFNMYTLGHTQFTSDIPSWLFMLPFVCISEVFRRKRISVEVRLGLLDIAYTALHAVSEKWPKTGMEEGIFQKRGKGTKNAKGPVYMTFWLPQTVRRAMNLCVTLYLEIWDWYYIHHCPYPLALSRFGTHSIECHFGITRSIMKGDARLERFLSAQMNAVLVREIAFEFQLPGFLRRFRQNEGGIVLTKDMEFIPMPDLDFDQATDQLKNIVSILIVQSNCEEGSAKYLETAEPVMRTMRRYFSYLYEAGEINEVHRFSLTSGLGMQRWFVKSEPQLAIEYQDEEPDDRRDRRSKQ
jgi:hypothetical protein